MLYVLSMFCLLVFKLLVGDGKWLEGLMSRFVWKSLLSRESRVMMPLCWEGFCRLMKLLLFFFWGGGELGCHTFKL